MLLLMGVLLPGTACGESLSLRIAPRLGWFEPSNAADSYGEVYGNGGLMGGIDAGLILDDFGLEFAVGGGYFRKDGDLVALQQGQLIRGLGSTTLEMVPLDLTVRYGRFWGETVRIYAGLGPSWVSWRQDHEGHWRHVAGLVYVVGAEAALGPSWRLGGEYRFLQVPNALEEGGLSTLSNEDDIGGHQVFFTASVVLAGL